MKLKIVNDYIDELSEMFPDVDEKSIKAIVTQGNRNLCNGLKQNSTTSYMLVGKSFSTGLTERFMFYKHSSLYYNNKAKFKQRLKDKKNEQ